MNYGNREIKKNKSKFLQQKIYFFKFFSIIKLNNPSSLHVYSLSSIKIIILSKCEPKHKFGFFANL